MPNADRAPTIKRAKAIGRTAYRLARVAEVEDFIEVDGERMLLRKFDCEDLSITLYEAPNPQPTERDISELRILHAGKKVMKIRWNGTGAFNVMLFDEGVEWIGALARASRKG